MIFINFEGADGSGKSTVLKIIEERFNQLLAGDTTKKLIATREPKGIFRDIILDPNNIYGLTEVARMFLYQADRSVHTENILKPNLNNDNIVISDRGVMSTLVYQSITTDVSYDNLINITDIANNGIWPDLIIVFDCDYDTAKKRMDGRELDYFDSKGKDFYDKLAELYITTSEDLIENYGHDIVVINARKSLDRVVEEVWEIILGRIQ